MTTLFHRTCDDGFRAIAAAGELRPTPQAQLGGVRLVWLTSVAGATREQLGLSSLTLTCDRMAHLVTVEAGAAAVPWATMRKLLDINQVRRLEAARGTMPALWWVSTLAIPVDVPAGR